MIPKYTTDETCGNCPYLLDGKCTQIETEVYDMPIWCKYLMDNSWFDYDSLPPEDEDEI